MAWCSNTASESAKQIQQEVEEFGNYLNLHISDPYTTPGNSTKNSLNLYLLAHISISIRIFLLKFIVFGNVKGRRLNGLELWMVILKDELLREFV